MALRHGVTAQEEVKLKKLVEQGWTWAQVVEASTPDPDPNKGKALLLADVHLDEVRKRLWEPLSKAWAQAKAAGFDSIDAFQGKKSPTKKHAADDLLGNLK